jgi:hypothetical protein
MTCSTHPLYTHIATADQGKNRVTNTRGSSNAEHDLQLLSVTNPTATAGTKQVVARHLHVTVSQRVGGLRLYLFTLCIALYTSIHRDSHYSSCRSHYKAGLCLLPHTTYTLCMFMYQGHYRPPLGTRCRCHHNVPSAAVELPLLLRLCLLHGCP